MPVAPESIQQILIGLTVAHHFAQAGKESDGIKAGQYLDELAGGCVGYIDKSMC
jgi:hypothetical protein